MDSIVIVVLVVIVLPIALAIWLIVRAIRAGNQIDELTRRLLSLESEVRRSRHEQPAPLARPVAPPVAAAAETPKPPIEIPKPKEAILSRLAEKEAVAPSPEVRPAPISPPLSPPLPPPLPPIERKPQPPPAKPPIAVPKINWEQFMGVKLFAWIGGLAMFLGVAFFVKYSFDNNLVPPELRVAIGFAIGLGLLVGGVITSRKNYTALSQTLCATGVVILYAVTFACRSVYHFEFFGAIPTFLLMAVITVTAFLIAVRLNALVVAILGMLGGFLTPILLSTGQDNPFGLFGYIAILDGGLIVVALHRRWHFLTALAALGTALMQIGWAESFFVSEKYFEANKILIALGVLLGFNALYLAAEWWAKRRKQINPWLTGSTLGLAAVALAFTAYFLSFAPLAQRPWLIFSFVFLIDLGVFVLVLLDESFSPALSVTGIAVFGLLAAWTANSLSNDLLNAGLTFYFIFAVAHSAVPVYLQRRRAAPAKLWGNQFFPPLALVLVLIPILKLTELSFFVWPFVLLVDLLAIGLAALSVSLLPVLIVLVLTLAATGALIFKIPAALTGLSISFLLLGAFAVFFVVASVWMVRKFRPTAVLKGVHLDDSLFTPDSLAAILPACSAALPFLLLIMATVRLPLSNPSPVFGLALLFVVLLLGVAKLFWFDWIPAVALACTASLEAIWHFKRFDPIDAVMPLTWYLVFFAVFAVFPFLFIRQFSGKTIPWATAALAGIPQFVLIHRLVTAAYPNQMMGLLPAAFAAPSLLSLVIVLKKISTDERSRMSQLAWFGGVALFFITLIFPIQFDRQWITIGWALEGAALLWLFHRVPHPGLRFTGIGLLAIAFVRLALNRAVLEYHPRSATPIFNWYLYTYGVVTIALFVGARLLAPPRNVIFNIKAPPILAGLGAVLAFLLLNIEIADFFSTTGSTLTFQFSGNFARDMTYSIAWAVFALLLLIVGIVKDIPATRYAGMGLLGVTLLKLFFHDLAQLGQLYRIGAFIGVAVIAMLASFAYQRFYIASAKAKEVTDAKALKDAEDAKKVNGDATS